MDDLIERLRIAAKIHRDIGGQCAIASTIEEAAAALEAEQRGRIVGSRAIDGLHVVVASAFTPGVEEQLLVRYDHYLAALEAAREDGKRMKRDIAELYEVMPMLPITGETMDAATDWFTRYCIDFHREINTAIDQARGKAGGEVEGD